MKNTNTTSKSIYTIDNYDDDCLAVIKNIFYGIVPLIIVSIGWLSNTLALIVYLRKIFKKNCIYIFFCSLAISDSIALLDGVREFIEFRFEIILFSCQLTEYISFIPACISSWIYVFISADRMLTIVFANSKIHQIFVKKISKIISLILLCLSIMVAYLPVLVIDDDFEYENESSIQLLIPTEKSCHHKSYMLATFWIDLIISVVLPSFFMFLFSTFTIIRIIKSRHRILKLKYCLKERQLNHEKNNLLHISINRRDKIFAISSLLLNFLYLILNLPSVVFYLIVYYSHKHQSENTSIYANFIPIVDSLFFLSLLQLFFTSFLTNSLFRKEFFKMFKFCAKYSNRVTSTTS
jgi:hypothetical protein